MALGHPQRPAHPLHPPAKPRATLSVILQRSWTPASCPQGPLRVTIIVPITLQSPEHLGGGDGALKGHRASPQPRSEGDLGVAPPAPHFATSPFPAAPFSDPSLAKLGSEQPGIKVLKRRGRGLAAWGTPGCSPVGLQHRHGERTGATWGGWGGSRPPQEPQSRFVSAGGAAVLCGVLPRARGTSHTEGAGSCPKTQRAPAQPRSGAGAAFGAGGDGSCPGSHGPVPGLAWAARARAESAAPQLGPWFGAGEASPGGGTQRPHPAPLLAASCPFPVGPPPPAIPPPAVTSGTLLSEVRAGSSATSAPPTRAERH